MKELTFKESKVYLFHANNNEWINFPRQVGNRKTYTDKKFGRLGNVIWEKILQSYKSVEDEKKGSLFLYEKKYLSGIKNIIPAAYRFGEYPYTTVQLLMINGDELVPLEDSEESSSCYLMIGYNNDPDECDLNLILQNNNKRSDGVRDMKEKVILL